MRFLTIIVIVMTLLSVVFSAPPEKAYSCSPWNHMCYTNEDCCRHLVCLTYAAKCVLESGVIVPGQDTRPIGNGPFPPGYPKD